MEFDKSRVYTALNADELKPGSNVIVSDCLSTLKIYKVFTSLLTDRKQSIISKRGE